MAAVSGCLILSRFYIISITHATTPPSLMQRLKDKPVTEQDLKEALMYLAWLKIQPDDIMLEIERACVRLSVA